MDELMDEEEENPKKKRRRSATELSNYDKMRIKKAPLLTGGDGLIA
jgi:hypothetical protein